MNIETTNITDRLKTDLIVDIEDPFLNLVVDLSGGVNEGLFDIGGCFGGGFHEHQPVLSSEGLPLLPLHFAPGIQITRKNKCQITRKNKSLEDKKKQITRRQKKNKSLEKTSGNHNNFVISKIFKCVTAR